MSLYKQEPELTLIILIMVAFLFGITVGLFICNLQEHPVTQEQIEQHINSADYCSGPDCWVLQQEATP